MTGQPGRSPQVIPSGSLRLDLALGTGGLPFGTLCEIYGPPGSGKTTLCQSILAGGQKTGRAAAFIDAEGALNPAYAARCGIDIGQLIVCQPEDLEQALDMARRLLDSGAVAALAVDSLTALAPRDEAQSRMAASGVERVDRSLMLALPALLRAARINEAVIVFTNQLRYRPRPQESPLAASGPETTAGLPIKLHAGIRLELETESRLRKNGQFCGVRVRIKIIKNKFGLSCHTIAVEIMYNQGICKTGEILDLASQLNVIRKLGSAYYYGNLCLGEGTEQQCQTLSQAPLLVEEIERAICEEALSPAARPVDL